MVERAHRQLKDSLRARLAGSEWPSHLPWVLLGLRAAPKEVSGISSAELVYGAPLTLPGELLSVPEPPPAVFVEQLRKPAAMPPTRPPSYAEVLVAPSRQLLEAELVFVRRGAMAPPLAPQYEGPYKVVDRGQKVFKLQVGDRVDTVSVDRLKPYLGASVQPQQPPRRGRPPVLVVDSAGQPRLEGGYVEEAEAGICK